MNDDRIIAVADDLDRIKEDFVIVHEIAHAIDVEWVLIDAPPSVVELCMDAVATTIINDR